MKFMKQFAIIALLLACLTSARAQIYQYTSFINGFNLISTTPSANTFTTNSFGGTNTANGFGVNNYVYPGSYPASANNSYIASNTIYGTTSAFGLFTNTMAIADARIWPDNNSDLATQLGVFISAVGVNNLATNTFAITFAPVVSVPVPAGSGTITNDVAMTAAQNLWTVSVTANGLTPVNVVTNPPNALIVGASKMRLLSIVSTTTNAVAGISTNSYFTSVLTNGVWQVQTNTLVCAVSRRSIHRN
jgi:hypothetical protein